MISNSDDYYVSENGNVYHKIKAGYYKIKIRPGFYGYVLLGISYSGHMLQKRVHRLVAEAFLENDDPEHKIIVMHLDNNKTNNHISNLKWGTISENTKQAFNDGLAKNDIGFDDSQSIPVILFDYITHEPIKTFGSIFLASKELNVTKTYLCDQIYHKIKNPTKQRKHKFYVRTLEEYNKFGFVL